MNPQRSDLIELANVPDFGVDLVMAHISLMREAGEPIPTSILALENLLLSRGCKAIDMAALRQGGFLL